MPGGVGGERGSGWGSAGEASTPFYINTAKMQSSLAEDRQLGRSERARALQSLPVPCSVALKFLCVCIIAVHANLAILQGSRTINIHI